MKGVALAVLPILALSGCGDEQPPEQGTTMRAEMSATPLQAAHFEPIATISDPLGGIWDASVAPGGSFAVLDVQGPVIHVFGADAAPIGTIDARGSGPGQIARPSGISWADSGHLAVWDPSNDRISRFAAGAAGISFVDQRGASAFGETGFCAMGERAWISFLQDGQVVHEVGSGGGITRSSSPAPEVVGIDAISGGARDMALEDLSPSRLLCHEGVIVEVGYFQPRVRALDPDGAVLWSVEPADFTPVLPVSPDDMGVGFEYAEGTGSHLARSIVPWGSDRVLVQYEIRLPGPRPAGRDFHALESRLFDLATGAEIDRTRDLPLFLGASGDRFLQVRQNPTPEVVVMERHLGMH